MYPMKSWTKYLLNSKIGQHKRIAGLLRAALLFLRGFAVASRDCTVIDYREG